MGKITTNPGEKKPVETVAEAVPSAPPPKAEFTELPLPVTATGAPRRNRRCCCAFLAVLIAVMIGVSITLGVLYMRKHHADRDHHRPGHWEGHPDDGDWDDLMGGGDHDFNRPWRPGHHSGEHGHHGGGHDHSSSSEEHGGHRPPHGRPPHGHRPPHPHPWPRPSGEPHPHPHPSGEPRPPPHPRPSGEPRPSRRP